MKRWRGLALGTLTVFLLSAPAADAAESADAAELGGATAAAAAAVGDAPQETAAVQEAPTDAPKETTAVQDAPQMTSFADRMAALRTANHDADAAAAAKAEKKSEKDAARAEKKAAKETAKREKKARYKTLFTDNGFTYYMDSKNTRWILRPYNSSEYMIDAWVRLVENRAGVPVPEDENIRPAKYFLEHYYISPQRHEIMFISELEVTGRPENAVQERPYDPRNWEQLVPGSIEDEIYEAVTARMKSAPGAKTGGMSVRDMVEEYARISL